MVLFHFDRAHHSLDFVRDTDQKKGSRPIERYREGDRLSCLNNLVDLKIVNRKGV